MRLSAFTAASALLLGAILGVVLVTLQPAIYISALAILALGVLMLWIKRQEAR